MRIELTQIMDLNVYTDKGDYIGKVEDIKIDTNDKRVTGLVIGDINHNARLRPGHADVVLQRVVEQVRILRDERDVAAQVVEPPVTQIGIIDRDATSVGVPKTHQQLRHRGLAGARRADQRHCMTWLDGDADVGKRSACLARISKTHLLQHYGRGTLFFRDAECGAVTIHDGMLFH